MLATKVITKSTSRGAGFTLVELIVSVLIAGALAAVTVGSRRVLS